MIFLFQKINVMSGSRSAGLKNLKNHIPKQLTMFNLNYKTWQSTKVSYLLLHKNPKVPHKSGLVSCIDALTFI